MSNPKRKVGRPRLKGERKETRTVSILPSVAKKAISKYNSLGKAIAASIGLLE